MGKCEECGVEIQYNKFKRYRGKVLCYDCYATRLERKAQKKADAELRLKNLDVTKEVNKYALSVPEEKPEE